MALLTVRQKDILEYLGLGCTNQEIARYLGLSVNTVKTHLAALFRQLDVGNRTEAVHRYRQLHGETPKVRHEELKTLLVLVPVEAPAGLLDSARLLEDSMAMLLTNGRRLELRRGGDVPVREDAYRLVGRMHSTGDGPLVSLCLHAVSDRVVWAQSFDVSSSDIRGTGALVATTLQVELVRLEATRISMRPEGERSAWECAVLGLHLMAIRSQRCCEAAIAAFAKALERDPHQHLAHHGMALAYGISLLEHWKENADWVRANVEVHAHACDQIDPDASDTLMAMAVMHLVQGQFGAALVLLRESVRVDPCRLAAQDLLAHVLVLAGEVEQAVQCLDRIDALSGSLPSRYSRTAARALACYAQARYEEVAVICGEGRIHGEGLLPRLLLVAALAMGGDLGAAQRSVENLAHRPLEFFLSGLGGILGYIDPGLGRRLGEGLGKVGLTLSGEFGSPVRAMGRGILPQ